MPGIESFSRSNFTTSRGTLNLGESTGGQLVRVADTPQGLLDYIYGPIKGTRIDIPPVEEIPQPVELLNPLPELLPKGLPAIETGLQAPALASVVMESAEGAAVIAALPELVPFVGIALVGGTLLAALDYATKEVPEKANLGLNIQPAPFEGGQLDGVGYRVNFTYYDDQPGRAFDNDHRSYQVYGPIGGVRVHYENSDQTGAVYTQIFCKGSYPYDYQKTADWVTIITGGNYPGLKVKDVVVTRIDNQPDTSTPQNNQLPSYQPQLTSSSQIHPGSSHLPSNKSLADFIPPSLDLSSPNPQIIELPANHPIQLATPGVTPITITPQGETPTLKLIPNLLPQTQTPSKPEVEISTPNQKPIQLSTLGSGPISISIPGYEPITVDPSGKTASQGLSPTDNPTKLATYKPKPQSLPFKEPISPLNLLPSVNPIEATTSLAIITSLLQDIQKNTTPEFIKNASKAAICETTQPGGCSREMAEDVTRRNLNDANNRLFDKLSNLFNNLANLGELALLRPIYNNVAAIKTAIGESELAGGISGFLQTFKNNFDKFVEWTKPGRILNMLQLLTSLHNAFMLSSAAKQTILQMVSDWIQVEAPFFKAFGIDIPEEDGKDKHLDVNKLLDNTIEGIFDFLFGEETVKLWETRFKALNRIYQAATNSLMAVQMMFFSVTMTLEIMAHNSSTVANALKKYGVVGHNAYPWQNPDPHFQNKWTASVETATNNINGIIAGAMAIDMVAQGIIQGRQAIDQFKESQRQVVEAATTEYELFENPNKVPEYKKALEQARKSEAVSEGVVPTAEDIAKLLEGTFS